jgi:GxxExxY protein
MKSLVRHWRYIATSAQVCWNQPMRHVAFELRERGLDVVTQKSLPVVYKSVRLDVGYRLDMLVEGALIVEIKSVEAIERVHLSQLLSYLRLADCRIGLLINFNVPMLKQGIRRVVNALPE